MSHSPPFTVPFLAAEARDPGIVGGKGANLGRLTQAGFNVPAGYTVTTSAYERFIDSNGLRSDIDDFVARFDSGDLDKLGQLAAELEGAFIRAEIPDEIARSVVAAYDNLGPEPLVAVRSSGTAEDLAEASFAGQHDTYLDVQGADDVIEATRRCWASLWTARAVLYRHKHGVDHAQVSIAVVIQTMVHPRASGVLFTANPLTTATDEMAVNASWGLGEAIVSGIVEPDEYILNSDTLAVKSQRLGGKSVMIIRDPSGRGTTETAVPDGDRGRFSLTDAEAAQVGELGRRVTDHYGGFPQDIEWAVADGELYLLQSRPITGVAFSWDEHIEPWQKHPSDNGTWTRAWADAYWGGAITPLFYSTRGKAYEISMNKAMEIYGLPELQKVQWFKYYKGVAYYNGHLDWEHITKAIPPSLRTTMMFAVAPDAPGADRPFKIGEFLRWHARGFLDPNFSVFTFLKARNEQIYGDQTLVNGLPAEQLRLLSDRALIRHIEELVDFEIEYSVWNMPVMWHGSLLFGLLNAMLEKWYTGDNPAVAVDLVSGTPRRTATTIENLQLWELARALRASDALQRLFREHEGAAFFTAAEASDEGRAWLVRYREFQAEHGHRGHSDRDIYFPRRSEDPSLDYNALKAFLSTDDSHNPAVAEEETNRRREAALADVISSIGKGPLGPVKVEAFKVLHDYIIRTLIWRDDERTFIDRSTMSLKRAFQEMSRRLRERDLIDSDRDHYFLGTHELYDLFLGRANRPLTKAKIAARMANFDAVHNKDVVRPLYLSHYQPADLAPETEDDGSGVLCGSGMSPGTVTATARVVRHQRDIGLLKQGEILVCNSTDPGWTPAFMVIAGIITEAGGLMSHASCLSREYGLPAVVLPSAMNRIPDGATVALDGASGRVTIVADNVTAATAPSGTERIRV